MTYLISYLMIDLIYSYLVTIDLENPYLLPVTIVLYNP